MLPAFRLASVPLLLGLAACDSTGTSPGSMYLEKMLADQTSVGGYMIAAEPYENFQAYGSSQLGAIYYVRKGEMLSDSKPVAIDLLCARLPAHGDAAVRESTFFADNVKTKFTPSLKLPLGTQFLLGNVSLDASYTYDVDVSLTNPKQYAIGGEDQTRLYKRIRETNFCKGEVAKLPKQSRPSVFQLIGIVMVDVKGTVKKAWSVGGTIGSGSIGDSADRSIAIDRKGVVFKVLKPVG